MSEAKGNEQVKAVTSWADDDDDETMGSDNKSAWGQPLQNHFQDLAAIQAEQEAQKKYFSHEKAIKQL